MNPAQNCFYNVMHGVEGGSGSPLSFNASSCYSKSQGQQVMPPTGLNATVQ
jgi:hypothetical protein